MTEVTFFYCDPRTKEAKREVMDLPLPPFASMMGWDSCQISSELIALIMPPPLPPPALADIPQPLEVEDIPLLLPLSQTAAPQPAKQRKARVQKARQPRHRWSLLVWRSCCMRHLEGSPSQWCLLHPDHSRLSWRCCRPWQQRRW